jgi:purine-nucleoside phosphorylase
MTEHFKKCAQFLAECTDLKPEFGIILGSGLGGLTKVIDIEKIISYQDIPGFPVSTVKGHGGRLIFGYLSGKPVVAMEGRFHYYEGYSMQEVTFPVRVMKYLGVHTLLVSNAAGGMNPTFDIGDLMVIKDHINLQPEHPLRGPNIDELGPRFPDMSKTYDSALIDLAKKIASSNGTELKYGVYCSVPGPTFETPAEYKYLAILGGDAVGMSTVPEIIVARHMNMRCFAMSVITDIGVEGRIVEISHDDVVEAAGKAEERMTSIIKEMLRRL